MDRIMRPRRVAMFLLILLIGGSVGVTAIGFETVTTDLPAQFTPAQPLPGDKAEWAYVLVEDDAPSQDALPFFRLEALAPEATWNETGVPHIAYPIHTLEAAYPAASDPDRPGQMEWMWNFTDAYADGGQVWMEDRSYDQQSYSNGDFSFESEGYSRVFLSGDSHIVRNCLMNALPKGFDIAGGVQMRECSAAMPPGDPDDPRRSENEAAAQFGNVGSKFVSGGAWHAIGQSQTPYGSAIVLEHRYEGEPWGVQSWYVEAFPYPIQMTVEYEGRTWVHQITEWTRGTPLPEPPQLAPLPEPVLRPLRDWGPDDAGVTAEMQPSAAYQAALDDGSSGLAAWLDRHEDAFVEYLTGGDAAGGDSDWTMQWRAGDDRFAVRVEWSDTRVEEFPFVDVPHKTATVEDIEPNAIRYSTPTAPDRVPDLASASLRFAAATGAEAQRWTYTWGCTDWVRQDTCQELAGPIVNAHARVEEDSGALVPAVQGGDHEATDWTMVSRPGGGIEGLRVRTFRTSYDPALASGTGAEPVQRLEPADAEVAWQVPSGAAVASVGAAAGLMAFLYLFWPAIKSAPLALFSRIRKDKLLDHPNRQRLYDAIEATPGIHHGALVNLLGQGRGTVDHHLRKLEEGGLVRVRSAEGYRCYFVHAVDRRVMDAAPALRSNTARKVLAHVRDHPGATGGQVAQAVGVNRATVSHHVKRMKAAGLLRSERQGNAVRFWIVAGMVAATGTMVAA